MSLELWDDHTQLACDLPKANKFGILTLASTNVQPKNTYLSVGETVLGFLLSCGISLCHLSETKLAERRQETRGDLFLMTS